MKQTGEKCTFGICDHDVQTEKVKIGEFHDFKGHPFKVERDMELFELTCAIKENCTK